MNQEELLNEIRKIIIAEMPSIVEAAIKKQLAEARKERLLSIDQTLNLFKPRPSRITLYNWMNAGIIVGYTIGGKRYFKYGEIMDSLKKIKEYSPLIVHYNPK